MLPFYEHRTEPLLPREQFYRRLIRHMLVAFGLMAGSLGLGVLGYHLTEGLSWLAEGRIQVRPYVEKHPLDEINEVFEAAHRNELGRRAVLVPGMK